MPANLPPGLPALTYGPVPYVPEVSIFQAPSGTGLWDVSGGEYHSDRPPPFWAFAWAGGQALARYILDHPDVVAGRTVMDLGAGSGLVALAAAQAGAGKVRAVEVDPDAVDMIRRNVAQAMSRNAAKAMGRNAAKTISRDVADHTDGIRIEAVLADVFTDPAPDLGADVEVLLAGDLFYTRRLGDQSMRLLRRAERAGIRVLVGDAARGFLPTDRFDVLATYEVPARAAVEGADRVNAAVWELRRSATVGHTPSRDELRADRRADTEVSRE